MNRTQLSYLKYLTGSESTVQRHLRWFDAAPVVGDDRLVNAFKSFVESKPFLRGPRYDWIRFLPPTGERWDFVLNLGVDGFGLAYALFVLLRNRRRNTPVAVRDSLSTSLTLLKYGLDSVVQHPLLPLRSVALPSSDKNRTGRAIERVEPNASRNANVDTSADGSTQLERIRMITDGKQQSPIKSLSPNIGSSNGLTKSTDDKEAPENEVIVISDTEDSDVEVISVHDSDVDILSVGGSDVAEEELDEYVDEGVEGTTKRRGSSSSTRSLDIIRKSKRRRTSDFATANHIDKEYPVVKEFGSLYAFWARTDDEHVFMRLLYVFTDTHSSVSIRNQLPPSSLNE